MIRKEVLSWLEMGENRCLLGKPLEQERAIFKGRLVILDLAKSIMYYLKQKKKTDMAVSNYYELWCK